MTPAKPPPTPSSRQPIADLVANAFQEIHAAVEGANAAGFDCALPESVHFVVKRDDGSQVSFDVPVGNQAPFTV